MFCELPMLPCGFVARWGPDLTAAFLKRTGAPQTSWELVTASVWRRSVKVNLGSQD